MSITQECAGAALGLGILPALFSFGLVSLQTACFLLRCQVSYPTRSSTKRKQAYHCFHESFSTVHSPCPTHDALGPLELHSSLETESLQEGSPSMVRGGRGGRERTNEGVASRFLSPISFRREKIVHHFRQSLENFSIREQTSDPWSHRR